MRITRRTSASYCKTNASFAVLARGGSGLPDAGKMAGAQGGIRGAGQVFAGGGASCISEAVSEKPSGNIAVRGT